MRFRMNAERYVFIQNGIEEPAESGQHRIQFHLEASRGKTRIVDLLHFIWMHKLKQRLWISYVIDILEVDHVGQLGLFKVVMELLTGITVLVDDPYQIVDFRRHHRIDVGCRFTGNADAVFPEVFLGSVQTFR